MCIENRYFGNKEIDFENDAPVIPVIWCWIDFDSPINSPSFSVNQCSGARTHYMEAYPLKACWLDYSNHYDLSMVKWG